MPPDRNLRCYWVSLIASGFIVTGLLLIWIIEGAVPPVMIYGMLVVFFGTLILILLPTFSRRQKNKHSSSKEQQQNY